MRWIICIFLSLATMVYAAGDAPEKALAEEAQALAKRFGGQLKPELKAALQAGGPSAAIEVCASRAPKIADALSAESGWLVKRVSLKSRNASRAIPDGWERYCSNLISVGQQVRKRVP